MEINTHRDNNRVIHKLFLKQAHLAADAIGYNSLPLVYNSFSKKQTGYDCVSCKRVYILIMLIGRCLVMPSYNI
jgi:hypothetical protein